MTMRKWFWRGAAVAVVTAAGACSAVYYAFYHPDSYLGQCLSAASQGGILVNALSAFGACDDATASAGDPDRFIPDDPVPVVELEPQPLLLGRVVEVADTPPPQLAGSTPIVIEPTETESPASVSVAELLRQSEESGPPTAAEEAARRPLIMPYADDGERPLTPMPFAEDEPVLQKADTPWVDFLKFWQGLFAKPDGRSGQSAQPGSDDLPRCQEDASHHQQYSGCPYTGCPATGPRPAGPGPIVPVHTEPAPTTGGGEESEMPLRKVTPRLQKKLRELIPGDIDCAPAGVVPRHPEIDTMEFRRTDRTLRELAPGGPY